MSEQEWQQQWSTEHERAYYYDPVAKDSVWELPPGAVNVKYLSNINELKAAAAGVARPEPKAATLAMTILLPVILVFGVLFLLHMYVARYHPDLLKESSRKKRDRAAKRAGRQPGVGKPKQKWKMSQDGKGGRSANS